MKKIALVSLLVFASLTALPAQAAGADPALGGTSHFDMTGFPQWSRDLRRGSIIAFGVFPIVYLFTHFSYDTYRLALNDGDMRYAPWPFTAPGGAGHSQEERFRILGLAAASSVVLAVVDHGIVRHRRNRLAREIMELGPGTPIIIRTPLHGEEDPAPGLETEEP
ncbi:MAG: hypothetical protein FWC64_06320 [Treponema sp.]|nr:hypothetical protein [Treponema sp.]